MVTPVSALTRDDVDEAVFVLVRLRLAQVPRMLLSFGQLSVFFLQLIAAVVAPLQHVVLQLLDADVIVLLLCAFARLARGDHTIGILELREGLAGGVVGRVAEVGVVDEDAAVVGRHAFAH